MKKTNQKGFTLVELLVVIVIIGVLAAVIIPNVTSSIDKAELSAAQQDAMSAYKSLVASLDLTKETLPEKFFYYTEKYVVLLRNGSLDKDFDSKINESTYTPNRLSPSQININGVTAEAGDLAILKDGSFFRLKNNPNQWRYTIFEDGILWDTIQYYEQLATKLRALYVNETNTPYLENFIFCNGKYTYAIVLSGLNQFKGEYYFDIARLDINTAGTTTVYYIENGVTEKIDTPLGSILCLLNESTGVYDIYKVVYKNEAAHEEGLKWEKTSNTLSI